MSLSAMTYAFMMMHDRKKKNKALLIWYLLRLRHSIKIRNRLHRYSLLSQDETSWAALERSDDNSAYRQVIGLSKDSFNQLNHLFSHLPEVSNPIRLKKGIPSYLVRYGTLLHERSLF